MITPNDALGYYALLGVNPEADTAFIKKRYYERAKELHPDHNESDGAVDVFQKLSVAYDVLNNPLKRVQYDLLSLVYKTSEFPPLGSLKIYKNQSDEEDIALRVLKQRTVVAGFKKTIVRESKDICNIKEAANMVLNTSIHNWLCGWWGKGAFAKNLNAIKYNMQSTTVDDVDNLKLLIHNAVAYVQENNMEKAWVYAQQIKNLWGNNGTVLLYIERFISLLDYRPQKQVVIPYWNSKELKQRQFLFPVLLFLLIFLCCAGWLYHSGIVKAPQQVSYYYAGGVGADTIENKIVKTDSDDTSSEYLVHLNKDTVLYHGPDNRYAVMTNVKKNQTVRITGYTPNKEWYQVIIDNGELGYAHKNDIEKGIGNKVPQGSKVYRN